MGRQAEWRQACRHPSGTMCDTSDTVLPLCTLLTAWLTLSHTVMEIQNSIVFGIVRRWWTSEAKFLRRDFS